MLEIYVRAMKSKAGLDGVIAAETALSLVDGERGELLIGGYPVEELAANATFEEVVGLLCGPDIAPRLAARRRLSQETLTLLRSAALQNADPMDALRMATASIATSGDDRDDAASLIAKFPTAVAAYARLRAGREPLEPRPDVAVPANFLFMLTGAEPVPARVDALRTYLITVSDHGLNASTFTARVIASTGSDLVSCITGAVGALKGPLHGGAPGPALELVREAGDPGRAETILRQKLAAGEKLMGFGHRIYKVRDPRADVLGRAAERLFVNADVRAFYDLARSVEAIAIRLLDELKPGRGLATNVEFYTALLLNGIGLEPSLFTPVFAVGRVAGWVGHALEQRRANRIIRPQSLYVGERLSGWGKPGASRTVCASGG